MTISGYCNRGFMPKPTAGMVPTTRAKGSASKFSKRRKKTSIPATIVDANATSCGSTLWRKRSTNPQPVSNHARSCSGPS